MIVTARIRQDLVSTVLSKELGDLSRSDWNVAVNRRIRGALLVQIDQSSYIPSLVVGPPSMAAVGRVGDFDPVLATGVPTDVSFRFNRRQLIQVYS